MTKPTTIRLPDTLLRQLDRRAKARGVDRATLLRDLLRDALARDDEEETLAAYRAGRISLSGAAAQLGIDPWEFFELLRTHGATLNVTLEDWLDSRPT
jgi:predicted transcriptional regulator